MSKRRTMATIPEPYEDIKSVYRSVLAMKELVEMLAGQRGQQEDWAVTFSDMPVTATGDTAWRPLPYTNSWVDYGAPYSPCGYRKLSNGLVLVRGLVANGTAAAICTLPAGYRPGITMLYIADTSPNIDCRVDVTTAGVITHQGGAAGWISLNNICFLAEN